MPACFMEYHVQIHSLLLPVRPLPIAHMPFEGYMRDGTPSVSSVTERPSHYLGPGGGSVRPVVLAVLEGPDSRAAGSEDRGWEPSPGVLVDLPAGISCPHPKGSYANALRSRIPRLRLDVIAGAGRVGAARDGEGVMAVVPASKRGFAAMNSASSCINRGSSLVWAFTMSSNQRVCYMLRSGNVQAAVVVFTLTFNRVSSSAVKFNLGRNCSNVKSPR